MIFMTSGRKIYVKIYNVEGEVLVAACDVELIGATLIDSTRRVKFYVDPLFFKGELRNPEELVEVLKKASGANLVGKNTVEIALSAGFIHEEAILLVDNVPIAFFARA